MTDRVTMADVARETGVSLMTVSRVVNDKGEVSPATRQRVLEAVEQLGYRPSGIARGLATQRTGTLGLVVPDVANPFFADVARGVEQQAYARGYNVFLCNTDEDPRRELAVLWSLEEKRVDGIVLCSSRLADDDLEAALEEFPASVLVNRQLEGSKVGTVLLADVQAAYEATRHLLHSGHEAIGFLAGPSVSFSGRLRASGYRRALSTGGIVADASWILNCAPTVQGGLEAAADLLSAVPGLEGLLCFNDLVAVGALQACAGVGRHVPRDVAVVGFDDIPLAALVTPRLTTCRVPRYELGAQAVVSLLRQIDGESDEPEAKVLRPELVVRSSAP